MQIDLDKLERLEREATPGPWEHERMGIIVADVAGVRRQVAAVLGEAAMHGDVEREPYDIRDASSEMIVAARNALPDLLAELRTLRARVAEMERDARLGAVVRDAVGDDDVLLFEYAETIRREYHDCGVAREPAITRVAVVVADALRAEEPEPIYDVGMDDGLEREEVEVCGARCDHGSECLALPGHAGGHETQHGCVFYDGAEEGGSDA